MHVVLVEPEIPQNTGNIVRLCAATNTTLHLVHPLGFSVEDRYLKRAGLDYWHLVEIKYYQSFQELRDTYPTSRFYLATTKTKRSYAEVSYGPNDFIVFGKETAGLPKPLLDSNPDYCITIPMVPDARSLNLSNSAAIVLYEALRQQEFKMDKIRGT